MVKFFLITVLFTIFSLVHAQEDPLSLKIQSFLSKQTYNANRDFIHAVFEPKRRFYIGRKVNVMKVVKTLRENGLLKLSFKKPQEFHINFKTSGSPIFFVKIMEDALRNVGYYRYTTVASTFDASEFTWSISLISEYATDPLTLQKELAKSHSKIIDVSKPGKVEWTYVVDITNAQLNVALLQNAKKVEIVRSLYAHWFNVSKIRSLQIQSSARNRWYPSVSYYDASLHLLKTIKKDKVFKSISLQIPKNAVYMKLSDRYTLKNIRDGLTLLPQGNR